MLLELNIKDFAIIDNLHLSLHRLFNVFTGETGAGKSIIIDAVGALLGGKIGADFVRAGCERASVEGIFSIEALPQLQPEWAPYEAALDAGGAQASANGAGGARGVNGGSSYQDEAAASPVDAESADAGVALATLLREYGITPEDGQLILSRDIYRSGRTVARINSRVVSQQALQQVASWLVDIHGQSEHMSLLRPEQHINLLDRYADLLSLREQLAEKVSAWRNDRRTLADLQKSEKEQQRRADFLSYEIEEIDKADLQPGEIEELEAERKVLNNAERLRELCASIYGALKGGESVGGVGDEFQPALDLLRVAQRALGELVRLDPGMQEQETLLSDAMFQLEDVASTISSYESDIEDDPQRLAAIEERLDLISRLKRKYGATIEEILKRAEDDRAELEKIVHRDELMAELQQRDEVHRREIGLLAGQLSARRREAARRLSAAMEEQLNDLNMQRARFSVEFTNVPDEHGVPVSIDGQGVQYFACDSTGIDRVQFLIAPNPGEPFKPLTKIASGGETSRLMLALKTILSKADATPTLIFDEIDAGISGWSGQIVGQKLWQLTQDHQVICVTHLPQIAAFADTHYNVNKQIYDERTVTLVRELSPEQRAHEVAHIMGGIDSNYALKSAEEMLAYAYRWKEDWLAAHSARKEAHK
jgi:DNA repair protein RecN (Recombination protein N)